MVDAKDIIKFNRTTKELQELILFLIAVAGKKADTTAVILDKFLGTTHSPFQKIQWIDGKEGRLLDSIKSSGFGCYTRLTQAFREIANSGLDLKTCSLEDLMAIHGVGRKSASCFLAWTRKGTKVAMLDTHLMKFITNHLGYADAPKATPSSKKQYDQYEKIYLDYCKKKKVDPTEYDLHIWKHYAYGEKL